MLLLSTLGSPALPLGWLRAGGLDGYADRLFAFMPNTQAFNVTGQPAVSLPLYWNREGLPIGIQLVAPFGREDLLIQLASQLEEAQPWKDRTPPVCA